jgi:hypothetical protein
MVREGSVRTCGWQSCRLHQLELVPYLSTLQPTMLRSDPCGCHMIVYCAICL